jgi:dTMP kinase
MSGLFVTFEGIDGCGKSTQVLCAQRMLSEEKIPCTVTREPGGTPIAERIRNILLSPENGAMCDACEVLLYFAARAQHVREKIAPELDKGNVVLCDRFMEATLAYQGYGRGIDLETLFGINAFATGGVMPALTFVFDIDVAAAFSRLEKTGKRPDRLEGSGREFFEKVRAGYLALAARHPQRIVVLNGADSPEELSKKVFDEIRKRLRPHPRPLS